MALTDLVCRNATCPSGKTRARLTDSGGLYLEISPLGSKRWFWKYYFDGKEKRLAVGAYSEAGSSKVVMSLRKARDARDKARLEHRTGVDPVQRRRLDKLTKGVSAGMRFAAIAREFHAVKRTGWSEKYAERWIERMEKDLFPWISVRPARGETSHEPSPSRSVCNATC
ncbi:MAG: Arm DNA-binding domain-containing protein [Caldimonas sp.]